MTLRRGLQPGTEPKPAGRAITHLPNAARFRFENCVFHRLIPRREGSVAIPLRDIGLPFKLRSGDTREKDRFLLPTRQGYVYFTGSVRDRILIQRIRSQILRESPWRKDSMTAFMPLGIKVLLLTGLVGTIAGLTYWFQVVVPAL